MPRCMLPKSSGFVRHLLVWAARMVARHGALGEIHVPRAMHTHVWLHHAGSLQDQTPVIYSQEARLRLDFTQNFCATGRLPKRFADEWLSKLLQGTLSTGSMVLAGARG